MPDVLFTQRAEDGVADGMHQRVCVRVAVEAFGMWNLNAAKNEFSSRDQLMNIVADADVNHAGRLEGKRDVTKSIPGATTISAKLLLHGIKHFFGVIPLA